MGDVNYGGLKCALIITVEWTYNMSTSNHEYLTTMDNVTIVFYHVSRAALKSLLDLPYEIYILRVEKRPY